MSKLYDMTGILTDNILAKNKYARLLAQENICVELENTNVPAFDIKNRVLILPVWSDYTTDLLDRIVGHEVAHAVYTPRDKFLAWVEDPKNKDDKEFPIFKHFVNIVEDIRIEKHIIRKYPGILAPFVNSCKDLMERDYFGLKKFNKSPDDLNIADRINLFFKVDIYDHSLGLKFNQAEQDMIDKLIGVTTWEETMDLAKELMEFCKKEQPEMFKSDFYDITKDADGEEGEEGSAKSGKPGDAKDGSGKGKVHVIILTQDEFEKAKEKASAMKQLQDKNKGNNQQNQQQQNKDTYVFIQQPSAGSSNDIPDGVIIPVRETMRGYSNINQSGPRAKDWFAFVSNVKMFLSSMIMEFERKKKAAVWLNRSRDLTGDLDVNLLYKYQISDELFRSQIKFKKGKKHSLVFFVDYSSSMDGTLHMVIKQLYLMVMFCRRAGIKHNIYAFNDSPHAYGNGVSYPIPKLGKATFSVNKSLRLIELFNDTMSHSDFEQQAMNLFLASPSNYGYSGKYTSGSNKYLQTHSTPLNDTLLVCHPLLATLKTVHKSDIMNVIFLTDGDSNPSSYFTKYNNRSASQMYYGEAARYFLTSSYSGKSFLIGGETYDVTLALVEMLKYDLGVNMVNFHITPDIGHYIHRYVSEKVLSAEALDTFKRSGKVGLFGKKSKGWNGIILSKDSMLDVKDGLSVNETRQILQLVVDLVS